MRHFLAVRLQRLKAVAGEAWPAWICVAVIVFASLIGWAAMRLAQADLNAGVRWAGLVLQWFGLLTIASGLHTMRQRFELPSLLGDIVSWLDRFAKAFRGTPTVHASVNQATADITLSASARVRRVARPGASFEERLAIVEANLNPLQDETDRGVQEVRRTIGKTDRALQHEEQERRAGEERTRRQFKDVVTGGLQLESVGLVWLFLGVLFTSIPDETAAVAVSVFESFRHGLLGR